MIYLKVMDSNTIIQLAEKALIEITYTTDGPLTGFVVLMRAMRKVAEGGDPEVYGNAYAMWMGDSNRSNLND